MALLDVLLGPLTQGMLNWSRLMLTTGTKRFRERETCKLPIDASHWPYCSAYPQRGLFRDD